MESYILITPVRNEADYIENTLRSVVNQTILPQKWFIVSDGSTDGTDEIVMPFEQEFPFISLLKLSNNGIRNFGSKVAAFNYGYKYLGNETYEFIGNLDGDIGFEPNYYEKVFRKFKENPKLGIAGGVRMDFVNGNFEKIKTARTSVAGAFQLFRRECFEQIGGYNPMKNGGIDAVAETMARMYGWKVESFTDIIAYHYRPTGRAEDNLFKQQYMIGVRGYLLGYQPLFFILRTISQIFNKPIIVGGFLAISGFLLSSIRQIKRSVPKNFIEYIRSEQKSRIKQSLKIWKKLKNKY